MTLKLLATVYLITSLFNAFLYGATSSIFHQSSLITHTPINVKFLKLSWLESPGIYILTNMFNFDHPHLVIIVTLMGYNISYINHCRK